MKSPILFLVFNRPKTTQAVFEIIRQAKPPKLYIAADGPRKDRPGESEKCEKVRSISTAVDWECEVKTLFREENLGCKQGVSSGIDWFFQHEPEGIILEDDTLPLLCFFDFCDELLEKYRHENVSMIAGDNRAMQYTQTENSYFFSCFTPIWGWATWRRSWENYDIQMTLWPEWKKQNKLKKILDEKQFLDFWTWFFDKTFNTQMDTWDVQWTFTCWVKGSPSIIPASNLVKNIGYGEDATHTTGGEPDIVANSKPAEINFPLKHPHEIKRELSNDLIIQHHIFNFNPPKANLLERLIKKVIPNRLLAEFRRLL
jgi:hypothetical protein